MSERGEQREMYVLSLLALLSADQGGAEGYSRGEETQGHGTEEEGAGSTWDACTLHTHTHTHSHTRHTPLSLSLSHTHTHTHTHIHTHCR